MCKNILRVFFIVFPLCLSFNSLFAKGLKREVIFKLREHEVIWYGEYNSNFSFNGYKYSMMIVDTVRDEKFLVWNGERIMNVSSRGVEWEEKIILNQWNHFNQWNHLEYHFINIDFNDKEKIYFIVGGWNSGDRSVIKTPDGFFHQVNISRYYGLSIKEFGYRGSKATRIHYYDGREFDEHTRKSWTSSNKKHTAELSDDNRVITIDGKKYVLPIAVDAEASSICVDYCYLFNNGACLIYDISYYSKGYHYVKYYWIEESKGGQKLDKSGFALLGESMSKAFWDEFGIIGDERYHLMGNNNKGGGYLDGHYIYKQTDKTGSHVMLYDPRFDYVLIDNKGYGKCIPIDFFYDEQANAFVWVGQEGRNIVRYTYSL